MLKKINQVLKIIGFNLVHAKKPKRAGYRSHIPIEDAYTGNRHVTKSGDPCAITAGNDCVPSPTCCQDEYNAGKTHFVGDGCKPAHVDASPTQDNNITGQTS